jgi:D-alanine-D-alanine ligase
MAVHDSTSIVLVIYGGPGAEREVSIASGTQVATALREHGPYEVHERCIDTPGAQELRSMADAVGATVVFPVLHGRWGEGGPLQAHLEATGLAYVGSAPKAAARAMDKMASKHAVSPLGVKTPEAIELPGPDAVCTMDPPLVLKPMDDGSSVDLRICHTREEIAAARTDLHTRRGLLMAERYIAGRELTVGIACGRVLPVIEIVPSAEVAFYDYQAKYERDDTQYVVTPDLPEGVADTCGRWAQFAWDAIGCRDVARVDYRLDDAGIPWFLEINTMPGFTTHSLVPMAAAAIGWPMPMLCGNLVDAALARCEVPQCG